ncbi:hypothetical protein A2U01_0044284 [Trifolium medium]|uniref:Uncharacterized protein n=1 Tax=Trifolium medium TaxID=97028 RepID=A0A392QHT4_9FABA|nr:hypothetical protein [Trifolium medium]
MSPITISNVSNFRQDYTRVSEINLGLFEKQHYKNHQQGHPYKSQRYNSRIVGIKLDPRKRNLLQIGFDISDVLSEV